MPSASAHVSLLPNILAEEQRSSRFGVRDPFCRLVAHAWKQLFPTSSRLLWLPDEAAESDFAAFDQPAIAGLPDRDCGVAWLATASAHQELTDAGLEPWGASPAVVRMVHDKGFTRQTVFDLGLDDSPASNRFDVLDPIDFSNASHLVERIRARLEKWPDWASRSWTLKPRWGVSGRGRVPGFGFEIDSPQLRGSMDRFAHRGGAVLEPFLDRVCDISAQFFVHHPEHIELLGTLRQNLSVSGSYFGHEGVIESGRIRAGTEFDAAVASTSQKLVEAAAQQGYFGPCGVDAFVFRLGDATFLRPCVEFNARFTVGTIVIGWIQRLLESNELRDQKGERTANWRFQLTQRGHKAAPLSFEPKWTMRLGSTTLEIG